MDLGNTDYLNPLFMLRNIGPRYFKPSLRVKDVSEIDLKSLERLGITSLIFDVDNTITFHHGKTMHPKIRDAFKKIVEKHRCCILSNAPAERAKKLEEYFGLHVVSSSVRKPKADPYLKALTYLKTRPEETAVVGDRIMTDIVGANKMGLFSIKVDPIEPESEPLPLRFTRFFENLLSLSYHILGL